LADGGPQPVQATLELRLDHPVGSLRGLELVEQPRKVAAGVSDEHRIRAVQASGRRHWYPGRR
jgi:hypothetical protein